MDPHKEILLSVVTKPSYQYAFLDSGIGGLPYLAELLSQAPMASCVYLADTKHFPYGEKTREEVILYAKEAVQNLLNHFKPELIIIACNTISVAALKHLRDSFSVPFVGTVPAIKLAAEKTKNKKIGLLATERTVCDPYTDSLIAQFASDCAITKIGDSTLIARVERELVTADKQTRLDAVRPSIERFRAQGVDTIVLACTHFLHLADEIKEVAGPDIAIIDSLEGVVHQAFRLVSPKVSEHGESTCYISGGLSTEVSKRYQLYAERFHIGWGGLL